MRITVLIENRPSTTDSRLAAEWGLSLHVAFNGHNILFDTGASGSFANNAEHLSVNIPSIDAVVLSHHHFDHGGGLLRFLELNSAAKVYLGRTPNGDCIGKKYGLINKYIGLDKTLIADYPGRFETASEDIEILHDVFIFPRILGSHPKPHGNKHLFLKIGNALVPDDFTHEIIMAIKEDGKFVVFTGCSHNGILNMVDTVASKFKSVPIKAVIGGFHLIGVPPLNFMAGTKSEIRGLARSILDYPIEKTYTGHCTGTPAFKVLKSVMGERLIDISTGNRFEV